MNDTKIDIMLLTYVTKSEVMLPVGSYQIYFIKIVTTSLECKMLTKTNKIDIDYVTQNLLSKLTINILNNVL